MTRLKRLRRVLSVLRGLQLGHDVDTLLHDHEIQRAAAGQSPQRRLTLVADATPGQWMPDEHFPLSAAPLPADGPTAPGPLHPVEDVGPQTCFPASHLDHVAVDAAIQVLAMHGLQSTLMCSCGHDAGSTAQWRSHIAPLIVAASTRAVAGAFADAGAVVDLSADELDPLIQSADADARIRAAMATFPQHLKRKK